MKKFSTLGAQDNAAQRATVIGVDLAINTPPSGERLTQSFLVFTK